MALERDDEQRLLEETAFLPEDDPRRRKLVRGLEHAPDSRRDAWSAVLLENEDLRLRLRGLDVPRGLVDRVRSVREGVRLGRRPRFVALAASITAAAVLLAAILVLGFVRAGSTDSAERAIRELAMLASMDHAARPVLSVDTDDLDTLAAALHGDAPFALQLTSPEPGAVLIGGRVCKFGDRALVYTCWRDGADTIALYQVRRSEFGLSAGLPASHIDFPEHGSPVSRCRVRVWTDEEFAYVVVHDNRGHGG